MLKLENISKSYQTGDFIQQALKNVSLEFRKSEFVTILGPSGSGKTTLLNIVGGLDRYDQGDLIINGKSTKKFHAREWDSYRNNCIGFIFQNYNLIGHISILANVEMGMTLSGVHTATRRKKALEVLEKVGLRQHAHKKPNQLSGGQMQRVAIARALANDPDIILADEPTGALDSQTSIQIMDLIREIAKDKLVIMVTHNADLASQYATRVVKFKDGELVDDSNPIKKGEKSKKKYKIQKTSMKFLTALKLSFNNIITKKGRTILTAFASSIGIIGIALVLSLSNGFDLQINKFEADTMSSFPISISPQVNNFNEEEMKNQHNELLNGKDANDQLYSEVQVIYPYNASEKLQTHHNIITEDYVSYLEKMDPELVSAISYYRMTNMNLLTKVDNQIKAVTSSSLNLIELPKDLDTDKSYLTENYDLLYGSFPESKNEIVLIVDSKNRVDTTLLETLGYDIEQKEIAFDQIIGITFKLVNNNDYYQKLGNELYIPRVNLEEMYQNKKNEELKVVGIIRGKEDNKLAMIMTSLYDAMGMNSVSSLGYSNELLHTYIENNQNSQIVQSQKKADSIVFMGGANFQDVGVSKEQVISMLGGDSVPSMVSIYTRDFEKKDAVLDYLDAYNKDKEQKDQIIYVDYASEVSNLSNSMMDAITIVLVAFSSISLVVSSIMIGIITYISVLERTKEIGILRALGARTKDISRVFNAETFIIGISSGVLGILIARLLIIPTNQILLNLTDLPDLAQLNIVHAIILIAVSVALTLIGGFIPACIASKKDPVEALRSE